MKIALLSKYARNGASSRLRSFQYIPLLQSQGLSIDVFELFDERYLHDLYVHKERSKYRVVRAYVKRICHLFRMYQYDLIWIEYEIFPYLPAVFERFLKLLKKPYLVDYDDAVFHHYDQSNNCVVKRLLANKIDVVMRLSHTVVVGNQYLAERAKLAGANNIIHIPTVIDVTRYPILKVTQTPNIVTIGWIGSPATQKYLLGLKNIFLRLQEKVSFKLLLIGASDEAEYQLEGLDVEVKAWSEDSEVDDLQNIDIGLMPLQDGLWEKGKCGYKLVQYMALGKPVIASPVGVNVELVTKENGFLANTHEQWFDALLELVNNSVLRHELGLNGREKVESRYTLQSQAKHLYDALVGCY